MSDKEDNSNGCIATSMRSSALVLLVLAVLLPLSYNALSQKTSPGKRPPQSWKAPRLRAVPTIPNASRAAGNRVILEHAENLSKSEQDSFMIVSQNVKFSKGPMLMYCDSAHYYSGSNSFDAFGNVRMEQGDTLFVYADELNYDGLQEIAYLYGLDPNRPVRLINRDVELKTDIFTYDLLADMGFYTTGGTLTDAHNKLISAEGEYTPATKEANFYERVHLTSLRPDDTLDIFTDTLLYNTNTHIADFVSSTTIINGNGTIQSSLGNYNTNTQVANLYEHSLVRTNRGSTLEGDTLFYDRVAGWGEAFGNMALVDSAKQSTLKGNYGYYNELTDSAFITGRALAMEYSKGDTLYMHGRYITSTLRIDSMEVIKDSLTYMVPDTTHVVNAWPRVRFYRADMQGICDSMAFVERDSNLYLHHHPVVWNQQQQVFGNLIIVHLNDSTVDRAHLPDFAFTAQKLEDDIYNQLTGKKMDVYFRDGNIERIEVAGNVQAIFFPEENDSTINKMVSVESSFLTAWMKDNAIQRMKMWPETSGQATPLYLAKRSMLWLPNFQWYEDLRPTSPEAVFIIPKAMEDLMAGSSSGDEEAPAPAPAKIEAVKTDASGKENTL